MELTSDSPARMTLPRSWGRGLGAGALGVLLFSLSLPATRAVVPVLGGDLAAALRAAGSGLLAAAFLRWKGARRPSRAEALALARVALGVVVGFPWLSSRALETLPSGHGALLVGLMPAATATWAIVRFGEPLTREGALGLGLGLFGVLRFGWWSGGGHLGAGHAWSLAAVALGAMGYAEGAALSRARPGAEVIAWAAAGALPFTLPWALFESARHADRWLQLTPPAAAGLAYVTAVSALLGFFAWYRGLAEGGTARVSQLQLAQPLLSVAWARLLLAEPWPPELASTSLFLIAGVAISLRARRR